MKQLSQKIEKAVYTRTWFNPSALRQGYKDTFDIFPDGKVVRRYYEGTPKKISAKEEWFLTQRQLGRSLTVSLNACRQPRTSTILWMTADLL